MKRLLLLIAVVLGMTAAYSQETLPPLKTVTAMAPKVDKSEIILECPDRYYYTLEGEDPEFGFAKRQVHCYYPATGKDVTLDLDIMMAVETAWYDKANDNVYIVTEDMGTEIMTMYISKITSNNYVSLEREISGMRPCAFNNYDSTSQCYVKVNKNAGNQYVRIKGEEWEGGKINGCFSLDLKPIKCPVRKTQKTRKARR